MARHDCAWSRVGRDQVPGSHRDRSQVGHVSQTNVSGGRKSHGVGQGQCPLLRLLRCTAFNFLCRAPLSLSRPFETKCRFIRLTDTYLESRICPTLPILPTLTGTTENPNRLGLPWGFRSQNGSPHFPGSKPAPRRAAVVGALDALGRDRAR